MSALYAMPDVDVDRALAGGGLTVLSSPGRTTGQAIEFWEQALWAAMDRHVPVMRAVGEMACEGEHFESEQEMLGYEAAFDVMSRRFPCAVICQHDVRRFAGPTILQALRAHPDILEGSLSLLLK